LRLGLFLNSQPEKMRRHSGAESASGRSSTLTWTKAPASGGSSHGAVRSQAETRTTTSSNTRRTSPGFISSSRVRLLRLLSTPSTATRSAIGVPMPAAICTERPAPANSSGTSVASACGSGASLVQPASRTAANMAPR